MNLYQLLFWYDAMWRQNCELRNDIRRLEERIKEFETLLNNTKKLREEQMKKAEAQTPM